MLVQTGSMVARSCGPTLSARFPFYDPCSRLPPPLDGLRILDVLGSITFSVILLSNLARSEVTYCCNFLARLLVKGSWFILLDVPWFWFIGWIVCMDGMSVSSSPS
jgi:hypothetical protein